MTASHLPRRPPTAPPTVIVGARVRTLTPGEAPQEAIAMRSGRIAGVGTRREMMELAGPSARIVDAAGATVLPAFTDSHTHFKRASVYMALFIDFVELAPTSIESVLEAVTRAAERSPQGRWVEGDGLDPSRLSERRFPLRGELDAVSRGHPVVLRGVGRHVVAANTEALARAGIDASTPDPPGGRIERDAAGEPVGILHEEAKLRLDADRSDTVIPPVTPKLRLEALSEGVSRLNSHGIATVHEIPRTPEQIFDWLALRERQDPRVRVRFYVRGLAAQTELEQLVGLGLRAGFGDEWIRLSGVKFSIDGSVSHRNAMVFDPYPGTGGTGLERVGGTELTGAIRTAHDSGWPVAVHAIGQRAVEVALDGFEALARDGRDVGAMRHRIEHAFLPPRSGQLERMKELGLILSTQPGFLAASGDVWASIFEDDDLPGVMPIASALGLGIPVLLNSDFPNSPLDPFVGVKAAVTRRTDAGRVLDGSEAVSVETALRLMTATPAYATFEEDEMGRLAEGYRADVVVVDHDPLSVPVAELDQVSVLQTFVAGAPVFTRSDP